MFIHLIQNATLIQFKSLTFSIQTAYINSVQTAHTYLIQISVGTFNSIIFIFIQSSWDRAQTDKSTRNRAKNFGGKLSLWGNYACVDCLPYV